MTYAGDCPNCRTGILRVRKEKVPLEEPEVREVYGHVTVQETTLRRYTECDTCGWVIDV